MTIFNVLPRKDYKYFLKGPIAFTNLIKVNKQKGNCLTTYLILHFQYDVTKERTFKIRQSLFRRFGIERNKMYRDLLVLEKLGFIEQKRKRGKGAVVTVNQKCFSFEK